MFPWLLAECASEKAKTLLILGDLTDAKDYHPAELTNGIVKSLVPFTWAGIEVVILLGNHDYLRAGHAYFEFLNEIPGIRFITSMTALDEDSGPTAIFLPHSKNPSKEWQGLDFSHYDYMFMHQTVKGSIASNGQAMDGEPLPALNAGKVYSGDIHVPQVIGAVEYVGSPYHVHFGDDFKPRCVLIDGRNRKHDLFFETISRRVLRVQSAQGLVGQRIRAGDHVRVVVTLAPSERFEWPRIKREVAAFVKKAGGVLDEVKLKVDSPQQRVRIDRGSSPTGRVRVMSDEEIVTQFVERQDLGGDVLDTGLKVIE